MRFWKHCRKHGIKPFGLPAWIWGAAAGIVFWGLGAAEGQFALVWRKAVMICMECIGIG